MLPTPLALTSMALSSMALASTRSTGVYADGETLQHAHFGNGSGKIE
ncbi:MAG: hypothetical protein ACI89J_003727 [Hyphomicrobiaceae bacterium]|jgi:hypothetical protein